MYLKHLSIAGFRGVGSRLDLPLDHRTIIYGPNGSGKSSALQAIPWAIFGKLPFLTGTVFAREDALVNDFLDEARAEITLALSDGVTIARTRDKQGSTGRGKNPFSVSFDTDDAGSAIQQLIGLSPEEFFAAIFLHQETIRDFITTTPEKRSATIDRMLGTYLLRTLVRVIDPRVPGKAIEEAEEAIKRMDRQLSQAGVISREMIQQRKKEYGDPVELPRLLEDIRRGLAPLCEPLGLPVPEAASADLDSGLAAVRRAQLETISALENQAGEVSALKERYHQAAVTSWQNVRQRREKHGDPADLPDLLGELRHDLIPVAEELQLPIPQASIVELEETLVLARQAQPRLISQLEESIGRLRSQKERYEQAAFTSWQTVHQRREEYGDPGDLPNLLAEVQRNLIPVAEKLGLLVPRATMAEVEDSLETARRAQLTMIGKLEKRIGQLATLKERYDQIVEQVVEDVSIPSGLQNRQTQIQAQIKELNRELPALNRQLSRRQAIEQELIELRRQVQTLPQLRDESEQVQRDLEALEEAEKQGKLYNQILTAGRDHLEQAQPEQCPLCKQQIVNLQTLLVALREETPADIEKMREEYKERTKALGQKRNQIAQLEQSQNRVAQLERDLTGFPGDPESEIRTKQEESSSLSEELATIQAEITEIEGRIKLAAKHRSRLNAVLEEIEEALEHSPGKDVAGALDQASGTTRERVTEIEAFDFQPIAVKLDRAKQLSQIEQEETDLRQRQDAVLEEIKETLGQPPSEDVVGALDKVIRATRERVGEVQELEFQSIAVKLDRAKQLSQIEQEETDLRRRQDAVLEEIKETLGQPPGEDVIGPLDKAIRATRERAAKIQALDLQPVAGELNRAKQVAEIQKDEDRLREFESSYQTASRQKERLTHQIRRLTDLRNALLDIAETTKRHQQSIVTGILSELDIHRFYQQLDPHPAYVQLQVEPELTRRGTYHYWIKALTDDRSHGTYVQTRFSTAQANCAAIAIFLAVNQHLSEKLETIILDDPSQSMDPQHQMRLAETLASIPRQVIVATEDPQMLEFLADAFDTPTVHELGSWTVGGASLAQ